MNEIAEKILLTNEHLKFDENTEKIVCTLTGHEMPVNEDVVAKYLKGKKFQKSLTEKIYNDYKKFLKPAKNNQLYCDLTCRFINYKYSDINNHVNGYVFLRAAEQWLKCKADSTEFKPITKLRKKDVYKFKKMNNTSEDKEKIAENGEDDNESEEDEEMDENQSESDDEEMDGIDDDSEDEIEEMEEDEESEEPATKKSRK